MKIQKLEIHNIASIEDATIDFTQSPLKDSDVFLITGETGAGKTTILDSICLALFNTTPRLNKGYSRKVQNNSDNLTLDDSRQLMRRDTGWAYVKLYFIGIDGCEYLAHWSVQRGVRKKATSAMDPIEWSIENITRNKTFTGRGDKTDDVEQAVNNAVGLDFAQFCRTTMLAQGEFTEFLKSDEDKKAEILEKIADFSEYTRIGRRVHEICASKKRLMDKAQKAVQDNGLNEEQLQELTERIDTLEKDIRTIDKEIRDKTARRDWIKTCNDLETEKARISQALDEAVQATRTQEYRKQSADIHDWRSTIQVRADIVARDNACREIERRNNEISNISHNYSELLGALEFNRLKLEESSRKAAELKTWIDERSAHEKVYAHSQTLTVNLENISEYNLKTEQENATIKAQKNLIREKFEPEMKKAQGALTQAQKELKEMGGDIERLQKEVEDLHLQDLRDQRTGVAAVPERVRTAKSYIDQWQQDINTLKERIKKHDGMHQDILDKQKLYDAQELPTNNAKVAADTLEDVYKKQLITIDDWARETRRNLNEGDVCPVCGQTISQKLPHEDFLSDLVRKARERYEEADKQHKKLVEEHNRVKAEIDGLKDVFAKNDSAIRNDTSVSRSAGRVRSAVAGFGIVIPEDLTDNIPSDLYDRLNDITVNAAERLRVLELQIKEGKDKEDKLKEMRKAHSALQNNINDNLATDFEAKKESVRKAETVISTSANNIKTYSEQLEAAQGVVAGYLERDVWEKDPKGYAAKLKQDASLYDAKTQEYKILVLDMGTLEQSLKDVKGSQEQATASLPQLNGVRMGEIKGTDGLLNKMINIATSARTTATLKEQNEKTLTDKKTEIDAFLNQNRDISMERLNELNRYSLQQVSAMEKTVKDTDDKVNGKKSELENVSERIKKHDGIKPELSADDTLDSLNASIEQQTERINRMRQDLGVHKKTLKDDKDKKAQLGDKEKKAREASGEYARWQVLNSLIGSADGRRFMIIAQCYLMDSLLDSANQYLKKLAPRYKLLSVPERLYLSVEDSYQGYATRSTDSLSGGEGFLVSLALALALADVGQSLAVDTLFIDEGFGTLSGTPLTNAINTLRTLHGHAGRHVGIISHLRDVRESISTKIHVKQEGTTSCSTVEII
jgi:exonuclease SbcC